MSVYATALQVSLDCVASPRPRYRRKQESGVPPGEGQHHNLLLAHIDNHHGVDGIKPIKRIQVHEHNGAVTVLYYSL